MVVFPPYQANGQGCSHCSGHRRKQRYEQALRLPIKNRSATLEPQEFDLDTVPGLVNALNSLVGGVEAVAWLPKTAGFDLTANRRIYRLISGGMSSSSMICLCWTKIAVWTAYAGFSRSSSWLTLGRSTLFSMDRRSWHRRSLLRYETDVWEKKPMGNRWITGP